MPLACAVTTRVTVNAALGWWWADPRRDLVIGYDAIR